MTNSKRKQCPGGGVLLLSVPGRDHTRTVLGALVSSLRTFRNVPEEAKAWTSIDEDALQDGFDLMATMDAERRETT